MTEIKVSFKVFVNDDKDNPKGRLVKEFVENRVKDMGNIILDAFDETIHDVEITEIKD